MQNSIIILSLEKLSIQPRIPTMTKEEVFNIYVENIRTVLPDLLDHAFLPTETLVALGANSIDRVEILVLTLETLEIDVPMVAFVRAQNIGEVVDILHSKL